MTDKHSFGGLVVCVNCGEYVSQVYADTQEQAQAGLGLCETCYQKQDVPDNSKPIPDDSKGDSNA